MIITYSFVCLKFAITQSDAIPSPKKELILKYLANYVIHYFGY